MSGLTSHQASQFLNQYGLNVLIEQKKKNIFAKFIDQFNNFLTILLIIAAFLSFIIGEPVDGVLILTIIVLNAFFGFYQEVKAEESMAALKEMSVTKVRVIRNSVEQEINSRYLVPGDIVFIEEGIKVPADGKIVELRSLEINESALTGESLPVVKKIEEEIFMGTIVAKGRGYMKITKTGMLTKFGQIASQLNQIERTKTPLQKKLEDLTRLIGVVGITAAVVVFFLSIIEGSGYFPAFLLSISLAVAVVPESLPAVMTITLAIGVREMAKKKSIIRKLAAIEALGSVTIIATDKTGTLTTNKMKVKEVYVEEKNYSENFPPLAHRAFSLLVLNGILCSTASLVFVHDHGRWDVLGDPTEGALLFLGQKVGLIPEMIRKEWKTVEEFPFDSVTKKMTVIVTQSQSVIPNLVRDPSTNNKTLNQVQYDKNVIFTKGAPEAVIPLCSKLLIGNSEKSFTPENRKKVEKQLTEWGRKGLRVLAFAYAKSKSEILNPKLQINSKLQDLKIENSLKTENWKLENSEKLTFLGMVAVHDAPRPEAAEAVARATAAGIKVIMITGDNEKTAESIGLHVGIIKEGEEILTGPQLDSYSDKELLKVLPRVSIFARTTPFHKQRIVKLFQEMNEIIAVTGDGVNDAIALKQADIGVAMGLVGTDVARETADMVVTDDNFASIVNAIDEGRNIIKNLKNAISYLLSCNIGEAIALLLGLLLGFPHIFYPLQFLYINLITDGLPALSLAFSPRSRQLMHKEPEKKLTLINSFERKYILSVGIISSILVLGSYYFYSYYVNEMTGKTAAFSILTLVQSFIFIDLWLSHRALHRHLYHLFSPLFFLAFAFPFICQYIIVGFENVARLFNVLPVSPFIYLQFVIISSLVMVGIKGVKILVK